MLKINYVILIILCFIIYSCQNEFVFSEAVPPELDELDMIPTKFTGIYLCDGDSSLVYITKGMVMKETFYDLFTSIEEVQGTKDCSMEDGDIYIENRELCIPFEYREGDSIIATIYEMDTLFSFKENEQLKYEKGSLFFNYQMTDDYWMTFIMSPDTKDGYYWETINLPDDLEEVDRLVNQYQMEKLDSDWRRYILQPTKSEFDKFLNQAYTLKWEHLRPINWENYQ